tara:strand:+ start:190 stop:477 length:288 start_codon:yes stop_codon:yes gene_type:complete
MSKKSFAAAPKPKQLAPEQIDAYVHGGAGHDTSSSTEPAAEKTKSGPMKRLSIDVPEETHRRFKVACAASGRKMAVELTAFIEQHIEELERETNK